MVLQATQQSISPNPDGSGIPVTVVLPPGESATQMAIGGHNVDAFGRLRTSHNLTLFDYVSQYEIDDLHMDQVTATGGTVTYDGTTNHIELACTASSGSKSVLQSHNYLRYQPGKGGYIKNTCNWNPDGDEEFYVVQRSSTTGSAVDTKVERASWNVDPLDGTGDTGVNIDLGKGNLFFIDFAYLGVGPVRFSIIAPNGAIQSGHTFQNPSANEEMYLQTANLPFRVEIHNDGTNTYKRIGYFDDDNGLFWEMKSTGATAESLNFFCCAVESEGGNPSAVEHGHLHSAKTAAAGFTVDTTELPVLSIRPKATYQSKTNRSLIIASAIDALVTSKDVEFNVYLNTTLTSPSWVSVGADSVTEYDRSATAFTGGHLLRTFYMTGSSQVNLVSGALEELKLSLDALGTTADELTITAKRLASATVAHVSLSWKELT